MIRRPAALLAITCCLAGGSARAQSGKGPVVIDINNPRRDLYKIAVPALLGDAETGRMAADVTSGDLSVSGWFKVIDPKAYLANLAQEGMGIVVQDWQQTGAEGVSKGKVTVDGGDVTYDFKLYEVARGTEPVLQRTYRGGRSEARRYAHAWSNEIVKYFTGEEGFFDTQIAFSAPSGPGRKDIYVMDYDGNNVRKVTDNGSQNILPAWAPSGKQIAYTGFIRGNPDLYLLTVGAVGKPKRISDRPGVNMGAAFAPDGSKLACTLSQDGNSEIYLLSPAGGILQRLTNNTAIDSSASWSPDGGQLAFVSNRHGSPQIWAMGSGGANQQLLTRQGNYNQEPAWCPKCPTATVAFTARDEKGRFDVFTIDVSSKQLVRLTENQGNNEHPSWAPNGRALVVASSRGGLSIITADGKSQRQVYKGPASTAVWGPRRSAQ